MIDFFVLVPPLFLVFFAWGAYQGWLLFSGQEIKKNVFLVGAIFLGVCAIQSLSIDEFTIGAYLSKFVLAAITLTGITVLGGLAGWVASKLISRTD